MPESTQAPANAALEIGPGMRAGVFPYDGLRGAIAFTWEHGLLKLLRHRAYPSVSIVPLVIRHERLTGVEEFRERYEASRVGIDELWRGRSRELPAEVEGFYDEHDADLWRQAYRSHFERSYKAKLLLQARIVTRLAGARRDAAILDYGCGAGVLAHRLLATGFTNVHLADIESPTFRFCRDAYGDRIRGYHQVGAARALEGSYDIITCLDCLEHTVDPARIARELIQALAPRGALVVSYPLETDFGFTHTRAAAEARPEVMALLEEHLDVVLPQRIFRKPA